VNIKHVIIKKYFFILYLPNVQAHLLPTAPDNKANPVTAPLAQEVQPPSETPRGRELDAAPCSAGFDFRVEMTSGGDRIGLHVDTSGALTSVSLPKEKSEELAMKLSKWLIDRTSFHCNLTN
jgi:hypothetical protein